MKLVNTYASHLTKGIMTLLLLLLLPLLLQAKDVTFQWTPVSEPVTGYRLYYNVGGDSGQPWVGTGLNVEGSPIMLGKVTSYTVVGLSEAETYHFVLTAYNEFGESGYSSVVTIEPGSALAPVIINISIK